MKALLLSLLLAIMPIHMYNTTELTQEILSSREGSVIIEQCIGICEDSEGNGHILGKDNQNYISYASVSEANPQDTVVTYFIYNPTNNFTDDIIYRTDFVLD